MGETIALRGTYGFKTLTGSVHIDQAKCATCTSQGCIGACGPKILKIEDGKPILAIPPEDARKGKCTECLACEIFCKYHEKDAVLIDLPIPGLAAYRAKL
jgi:ferredoxin-like protein FixX